MRREESGILRTRKGALKSLVEGGFRQVSQPGGVRRVKLLGSGVGILGWLGEALWRWKEAMLRGR